MCLSRNIFCCAVLAFASLPVGAQVLTLEAARARALERQPALAALELNARAIAEAALSRFLIAITFIAVPRFIP